MLLYIVRHGQTDYNIIRRIQGQSNSQLTDLGRQQAALLAKRLAHTTFNAFYTSDLDRAMDTAKTTGTAYFALKVGTNKTSFTYSFDNFTLKDLTAEAETALDQVHTDAVPTRTYNLSGLAVNERPKQSGIYIITDGKHTQKVLSKK